METWPTIDSLEVISPSGGLVRATSGQVVVSEGDTLRVYLSFKYRASEDITVRLYASVNSTCRATKKCTLQPSPAFVIRYETIDIPITGAAPGVYDLAAGIEGYPEVSGTVPGCVVVQVVGNALVAMFESNHPAGLERIERENFERVTEILIGEGYRVTSIGLPPGKSPILYALARGSVLYLLSHTDPWEAPLDPTSFEPDMRLTAIEAGRQFDKGYTFAFVNGCTSLREVGPGSWAYELTKRVPGAIVIGWNKIEWALDIVRFADRFFEHLQQGSVVREAFSSTVSELPIISRDVVLYTGTGTYTEYCYVDVHVPHGGTVDILSGPYQRGIDNFLCVPKGETVWLTARPLEGHKFDKWVMSPWDIVKDDYIPNGVVYHEPRSGFRVDQDEKIFCWFRLLGETGGPYSLKLSTSPRGAGGISPYCGTSVFFEGRTVTVEAVPYSGFVFDHWEGVPWGDGISTSSKLAVILTSNVDLTAVFEKDPIVLNSLKLWVKGLGYVVSHMSLGLTLEAHPYEGYRFDHWERDASGTSPTTSLVLDRDKAVIAHFVKDTGETCTLNINYSGSGTVRPLSGVYARGQTLELTAYPAPGWQFDHWAGTDSNFINPTTVVMNQDRNVFAYFIESVRVIPGLEAVIALMVLGVLVGIVTRG